MHVAAGSHDFSQLEDSGNTLNENTHNWVAAKNNHRMRNDLQEKFIFKEEKIHYDER